MTLTSEEVSRLGSFLKSSEAFVKDRAKILLLSHKGKAVKEISASTGIHRPRIENIINNFNSQKFEIFTRKKSTGRPRVISSEHRAEILGFLNTEPMRLGLHFTNWSLKKLSAYAKTQGLNVSPAQIQRIIAQDNIKYKKKVSWLYSNDPEFAKKNL